MEDLLNEILDKVLAEEREDRLKREAIIKEGCPCVNKVERVATISRIHFLECAVCNKQFTMDGREIE